ncbi:helix-turn-helix domain-containing protein [Maritalea porphyrae]|uniref:helix-turn-helix domain-containing protein n=1 Tax=Maritalea porphyrae TaxID=880732 RepID=UPI003AFB5BF1
MIEREYISQGLITKLSFRSIAQNLNRSISTVGREVRKNCGLTALPHAGPQRTPPMSSLRTLSTQWNC